MAILLKALRAMSLTLAAGGALAQVGTPVNSGTFAVLAEESGSAMARAQPETPNTMMATVSTEERRRLMRQSLAWSSLSLRERINVMTYKVEAQPDLTWDDVISSMRHRANKINLKFVGAHLIHKEIEAITGKPTPKVAIYHFCDALVARDLLDYSLEAATLLPCRIAVVEDSRQRIWLAMFDGDIGWLDGATVPGRLPDRLHEAISGLRRGLEEIIQAGASGTL